MEPSSSSAAFSSLAENTALTDKKLVESNGKRGNALRDT